MDPVPEIPNSNRSSAKAKARNWPTVLLFAAPLILALVYLALPGIIQWLLIPRTETNLRKYPQILAAWPSSAVGHFPKQVPADAPLKKFSSFPGFLQGGPHIQLRLRHTPERIQELYELHSRQCTKSFFGGDSSLHAGDEDGMPTTYFYTGDNEDRRFPEDYEIMIFAPVIAKSERLKNVQRKYRRGHGVAISKKRSEIVYWADFE